MVSRKDVAALTEPPTPQEPKAEEPKAPFFMSEGARTELEFHGWAVDPVTGSRIDRNPETGAVTVTDRLTGNVSTVQVGKRDG